MTSKTYPFLEFYDNWKEPISESYLQGDVLHVGDQPPSPRPSADNGPFFGGPAASSCEQKTDVFFKKQNLKLFGIRSLFTRRTSAPGREPLSLALAGRSIVCLSLEWDTVTFWTIRWRRGSDARLPPEFGLTLPELTARPNYTPAVQVQGYLSSSHNFMPVWSSIVCHRVVRWW